MKTLKIKSLENRYVDRDEILLHAAFQVLQDFMEKEKPNIVDWNRNKELASAWREIKSLYRWWTKIRPARKNPFDSQMVECPPLEFEPVPGRKGWSKIVPYDKEKYKEYDKACDAQHKAEIRWEKQDQKNLHRLIYIRMYLWT